MKVAYSNVIQAIHGDWCWKDETAAMVERAYEAVPQMMWLFQRMVVPSGLSGNDHPQRNCITVQPCGPPVPPSICFTFFAAKAGSSTPQYFW